MPDVLKIWQRLAPLPGGKALFSRLICAKAPYFGSIRPHVSELDKTHCEVRLKKRRAVTNHIGTVHAIAMCNMAELAGGLLTDVAVPDSTQRWIPKGMSVDYLKKAETDLRGIAHLQGEVPSKQGELPVKVEVFDSGNQLVFRAHISMWVSPKR